MLKRIMRPRVLIYSAVLCAIIISSSIALFNRLPVKVDVIRDRNALSREVEGGQIENVYRLQIMNTEETYRDLQITATGIDGLKVQGIGTPLRIDPSSTRMYTVNLRAPAENVAKGSNRIEFHIVAVDADGKAAGDAFSLHEKSVFFKS